MTLELTEQQLRQVDDVAKALFSDASKGLVGLLEVANQVISDAVDVRTVLKSNVDAARHPATQTSMEAVARKYETAIAGLKNCASGLRRLIQTVRDADYPVRLERLLPTSPDGLSRERMDALSSIAVQMKVSITARYMEWSLFIIRLAGLINGLDRAHRSLIQHKSGVERLKSFLKPALGELIGQQVPLFGILVAVAESQQPELYLLLDKMEAATGALDQINAFFDVLEEQLQMIEVIADAVARSEQAELAFLRLVETAEAQARG